MLKLTLVRGTNRYHMPPDMMDWEGYNFTSVVFLPKMYNLPSDGKYKANPSWDIFYEKNCSVTLQKYQDHERQRLKNCQIDRD